MNNLEVRVHSEISSYTEKFYGLTVRQWFSIAAAAFLCIPTYILLKDFVNSDILQILIALFAGPILAVGFLKIQELPFEQFALYFKRTYLNLYKPLKFQSDKDTKLEKEYYQNLKFTKKLSYLINRNKVTEIPIADRIKMEGKEKSLSKKEIKELKAMEKKKIKAQQKIEKQRRKEEKELRKLYRQKEIEEEENRVLKTLEETQNYVDDSIYENMEDDFVQNKQTAEEFYYMSDDLSEAQVINNLDNSNKYISFTGENRDKNVIENKNEEIVKTEERTEDVIDREIKEQEDRIKNLIQEEDYRDSQVDLAEMLKAFSNSNFNDAPEKK